MYKNLWVAVQRLCFMKGVVQNAVCSSIILIYFYQCGHVLPGPYRVQLLAHIIHIVEPTSIKSLRYGLQMCIFIWLPFADIALCPVDGWYYCSLHFAVTVDKYWQGKEGNRTKSWISTSAVWVTRDDWPRRSGKQEKCLLCIVMRCSQVIELWRWSSFHDI